MKKKQKIMIRFKNQNPSVFKFRNKKIVFYVLKCLPVWVIAPVICFIAGERKYFIPLAIIAAVILTLLFLKRDKLIGGRWCGIIENVKIDTRRVKTEGKVIAPGFYTSMHDQNFIVCSVLTDRGKTKQFALPEEYDKVYRKGDRVLSIPGIAYKIDLTNKEMTLCPRCGSIFPSENKECITLGCRMKTVKLDT